MIRSFVHGISSGSGRILKRNQCLYLLKKRTPSKEFCSDFPTRHYDDKYCELRSRLAAVPYSKMLAKEADAIRHELCYEKDKRLEDVFKWFSKVLNYNVGNGKNYRPTALLKAYCAYGFSMDDPTWNQWDSEGWRSAILLAWCLELQHTYLLMQDDIVDQSILRRGKPCWYKRPDVGLRAIIDVSLLESGVYRLLQRHFSGSKCYTNILHEFLQAVRSAMYGQCLDMMLSQKNPHPRFDLFTFEKFQTVSEYKASDYTFRLPVHLALHLAGGYSSKEFEFTNELCLKLGLYIQIKNDYEDCFGQSEVTGKTGNDIREGKCTWLAVKFLEEASEPMKKQFFKNYGVDNEDAICKILELYRKRNLPERFKETNEQTYAEICTLIESKNCIKTTVFYDLLTDL